MPRLSTNGSMSALSSCAHRDAPFKEAHTHVTRAGAPHEAQDTRHCTTRARESVTRSTWWYVRVRAAVRSEGRRPSGSAGHMHRPARPTGSSTTGSGWQGVERPPRTAGEGVARSKLVVRQRLGGRARPPACAQQRAGCNSQAAQALTGARLETSVGMFRTADRPPRAPGGLMYPPTPQERVGSIDAAHLAVGACAGRQTVASAAQHEYHAFVDVTRPLP